MHVKENNKPPRNGARNLVRMRRLKKKIGGPGDSTSGRVVRALYLDDAHWDLGPEVAFSLSIASLSDTGLSDRHWGREMSAPRPHVTDLFRTCSALLGSLDAPYVQMAYIWQSVIIFSSIWYLRVWTLCEIDCRRMRICWTARNRQDHSLRTSFRFVLYVRGMRA